MLCRAHNLRFQVTPGCNLMTTVAYPSVRDPKAAMSRIRDILCIGSHA